MALTLDEFSAEARKVLTKLESPEEIGGIVDNLIAAYTERDAAATSAESNVTELTNKNELLQKANMELYLRTGVKSEKTDDLSGTEEAKGEDFNVLFDESGELA